LPGSPRRWTRRRGKIPGYGAFGDDEAEFEKFSVDLGCTPAGILIRQPPDQVPDLFGDPGPTAARPGTPTPVQPKTRAVPADDGLWLHDHQDVGPTRPEAAEGGPEQPIQGVQGGPRSLVFQHRDLLSEGKNFEGGVGSTAEEDTDHGEEGEDELRHELTLVAWRNVAAPGRSDAPPTH